MQNLDESLLTNLPPFGKLKASQIREILDLARARHIPREQSIFQQGADVESFYLLLDGHIRVERFNPEGNKVIPLHIPPGQLFGIAAALGRETYPATAVAAMDCVILQWPTHLWSSFVAQYDGFATETYKVVGNRLEEINNRIMELATQHVEQRVACALLRLSRQSGKTTDMGTTIGFPVTRRQISEMTGSTLHTVSRLLSSWERDGIVASQRKKIQVLDQTRLETLMN